MKGKVMRPFRPPREAVQKDKPDRTMKDTTGLETDSEEATELGLVYGPWIIKETQNEPQLEDVQHPRCNSPNVHVTSTVLTSPSTSEFKSYLEARESNIKTIATQSMGVDQGTTNDAAAQSSYVEQRATDDAVAGSNSLSIPLVRPANVSNDEWWESVLQSEKERVSRLIDVDDILLGTSSSDDDTPIVSTLQRKTFTEKAKKKTKTLWTYETVVEPTGVVSKYWDADAPSERATKRQAKEKLSALQIASTTSAGATKSISHNATPKPISNFSLCAYTYWQ
jgi:hypothetical protein